jgi:hypothetical protein
VAYPLGQNNINIINGLPFYHSLWGDLGNLSSCRQVIPPIQAVERRGRVGEEGLCLGEGFRKSCLFCSLPSSSLAVSSFQTLPRDGGAGIATRYEGVPRGRQAPGARTDGAQRQHQQRGTIEADCARWGPVLCRQGERSTAVWHRAWGARVPHQFLLWAYGEQPQEGACRTTRHTRLWHHARTGPIRCPPVPPSSNAPPRRGTPCADRTALVCRRAHPPPSERIASLWPYTRHAGVDIAPPQPERARRR